VVSKSNLLAFVDAKLAYEIDVVSASRAQNDGTAMIVDTRKQLSWDDGHIAGAMHLHDDTPDARLTTAPRLHPRRLRLGPGCNGAAHTARRLPAEGLDVRELIGGYEYWGRNELAAECGGAVTRKAPDRLVTAES
jgi:hypothetical protein